MRQKGEEPTKEISLWMTNVAIKTHEIRFLCSLAKGLIWLFHGTARSRVLYGAAN
jgi:hypothetical protein